MLLYISYHTSILSHISYTRTHHCSLSTHHYTLLYTSVHSTNLHYYTMHYMYCSYIPLYPLHMLIDHHLTLHNYTYHTLALVHTYIYYCSCTTVFAHIVHTSLYSYITLHTFHLPILLYSMFRVNIPYCRCHL